MNNAKINNEINLTYPDGFREMNEEELATIFSSAADRWGVYDSENRIILSVSWQKLGFFKKMHDPETLMIDIESRLSRSLINYQRVASYPLKLEKKRKAYGIRFWYRVNNAKLVQYADLVVFKNKKTLYTLHYITRKDNAGSSRAALQDILNSITVG